MTVVSPSRTKSQAAFSRARQVIPGGVNSPVRAFRAVGGDPPFIARGAGSHIIDVDGNDYVDYVLSWGPLILGHAEPRVIAAITTAAAKGTSFGAPTELESELAEEIISIVPGIDMVRFVSSGTEATMSALRLARAATGRAKIIKFAGCYHGHADFLLAKAGSGIATLGLPDSPGVTANATADVVIADYNDLVQVEQIFTEFPEEIAAIIVEPVAGNMGVVGPQPGFLEGLRALSTEHGAILIFDEVLSGFRVALGGAIARFGVQPDLVTLGKVVGGGLPLAAYAGRRDLMEMISPAGPVYQAGTLSGNPLAVTAGLETLRAIREPGVFARIEQSAKQLIDGLAEAASTAGISVVTAHFGTMGGLFFTDRPVTNYAEAATADTARFARWFRALLDRGVYIAPSQFETLFLSRAHTQADLDHTLTAAAEAFALLS
ncbi:MAG: glutamate-1-semialdehyde 2,1-aminomutase [Thermomicrobiales bacterium]